MFSFCYAAVSNQVFLGANRNQNNKLLTLVDQKGKKENVF